MGAERLMLGGGPGGRAREGRRETRERARQGESRRSSRLLNPFWFDFPQVTQLPGFRQML